MSGLSPFNAKAFGQSPGVMWGAGVSGAQGAWRIDRGRLLRYLIAFYLACVLAPGTLILARHGAHVTLTRIAVLFGILMMSMVYARGLYRFYAMRALPDVAQVGLIPGVFLFLLIGLPAVALGVTGNASLLIPRPLRSSVCDRWFR